MPEIPLYGCRPEPLMSYLKALGVLRLVAEQKDTEARGRWAGDAFFLSSRLDEAALVSFFLSRYSPTPVVVPWSGSDFFGIPKERSCCTFRKTPTSSRVIRAFLATQSERLRPYREVLEGVLQTMSQEGVRSKPDIETKTKEGQRRKARFLAALRSRLPDEAVPWLDAAVSLRMDSIDLNSLLGTGGGSDGNTHFSDNFMQNLWDCLPEFDCQRRRANKSKACFRTCAALKTSLFGVPSQSLVGKRTAALFDAGAVGGPNATQGMERKPHANPWDFILAIEGALCFAGAVVRRHCATAGAMSAFPFAARLTPVGYGALTYGESGGNEIWLPLWERSMRFDELRLLFSEGRCEVGRRPATNGLDFARAIAGLGVDSGITAFLRSAIVRKRVGGENYTTAVPAGRFRVRQDKHVSLLESLDAHGWLDTFRGGCGATRPEAPPRFPAALRRLDAAIFDFCRYGGAQRFAQVLCALGQIERELSVVGDKPGKIGNCNVNPVPYLDPGWIGACDDGTAEFRIALALASIQGQDKVGPLRGNLEPVAIAAKGPRWAERDKAVVWSFASLCRNLAAVLERRLMDAGRHGVSGLPLASAYSVQLSDITAFLEGRTDDRRIEELLWGAILIKPGNHWPRPRPAPAAAAPVPRAYALLKLLFLPDHLALGSQGGTGSAVRPEPGILAKLRGGDLPGATAVAARRLRASGFVPMPGPASDGRRRSGDFTGRLDPVRLAAALLIPIQDVQALRRLVLRPSQPAREGQE